MIEAAVRLATLDEIKRAIASGRPVQIAFKDTAFLLVGYDDAQSTFFTDGCRRTPLPYSELLDALKKNQTECWATAAQREILGGHDLITGKNTWREYPQAD